MAKGTSLSMQVRSNIRLVRRNLENLRLAVPKIAKARLTEAAQEIVRRMSRAARKITYPVPWDSERQRIKVIIMILKRQGFLPYIPTQAHERGWKYQMVTNGVKVMNNVRGSKYLYGTLRSRKQSRIHVGRRPVFRDVYDAVMKTLPKKVIQSLKGIPKSG